MLRRSGVILFVLSIGITTVLLYEKLLGARHKAYEILITQAHVEAIRQDHVRQTGTLPSKEEELRLLDRYIDEEIMVREAMNMGMDQGDPIVRRRLVQKMESALQEFYARQEPSEADIQEYFEAHRQEFIEQPRFFLTHVFIGHELNKSGSEEARIASIIERLLAGEAPEKLGSPFPLGCRLEERTEQELARIFGDSFSKSLSSLPVGTWSGPVMSSYGAHIVRVESTTPARHKELEEVRQSILNVLRDRKLQDAKRRELSRIRERYRVRFIGTERAHAIASEKEGRFPRED